MFLFTTPTSPTESPPAPARPAAGAPVSGPVVQAIRDGAMATGVGFDYLLATARRESSLDPAAKAPTSTATGLFQFVEQTWLGVMKSAGGRLGLQAQADAIVRQSDGSYTVADPGQRQAILDLRRDPRISATLAGALTQQNGEALGQAMGHAPAAGDLYAAHVLGAKGAAALIATARTAPDRAAALDLPEAAAANRGLFYDRAGRPRSAAELYAALSAAARDARADTAAATDLTALRPDDAPAGQAAGAYATTATAFGGGADLRSLFQTDRRNAVSDAAARLWQARNAASPTQRPAPTYFPHAEPDPADGPGTTGALAGRASVASARDPSPQGPSPSDTSPGAPPAARLALVNAPLPPRRPAGFAAAHARNAPFAPRSGP